MIAVWQHNTLKFQWLFYIEHVMDNFVVDLPSQITTHLCLLSRECLYNLLSLIFSILALFVVKPWPLGLLDLDSKQGKE